MQGNLTTRNQRSWPLHCSGALWGRLSRSLWFLDLWNFKKHLVQHISTIFWSCIFDKGMIYQLKYQWRWSIWWERCRNNWALILWDFLWKPAWLASIFYLDFDIWNIEDATWAAHTEFGYYSISGGNMKIWLREQNRLGWENRIDWVERAE